jgi:competence protein CoiA
MIRYANVSGEISTPQAGLRGVCPACGNPVTSKCGTIKIHHWAHLKQKDCDPWWEPMTQWHIDWQSYFPTAWREKVSKDEITGEFHRADIQTPNGITIEFQHSPLSANELLSRNNFYKKIIWVVNGHRFKHRIKLFTSIPNPRSPIMTPFDFLVSAEGMANVPRYRTKDYLLHGPDHFRISLTDEQEKAIEDCQKSSPEIYWLFDWSNKHRCWLNSEAPVLLDFGENTLYWIRKRAQIGTPLIYLQQVTKKEFIAKYSVNEGADQVDEHKTEIT